MSHFMPSCDRNALYQLINNELMSLAVAVLTQALIAHLVMMWMKRVKEIPFPKEQSELDISRR
jgi:hypothetical protein